MTPGKVWGEPDAWRYDRGPVAVLKPARTPDYTAPAMGFVETPLYTRTAMEAYAAEKVTMLTPEQIADGWIAHDGGPCPVPLGSRVTIMCRGGETDTDEARKWWWGRSTPIHRYDIIAYRPEPRP